MSEAVSREEFRMLADRVVSNERRLESIDVNGTRGVVVLAVQLQELSKDLATHEVKHDAERDARLSGRKWLIALAVAFLAAVDGPIVTVLLATHPH